MSQPLANPVKPPTTAIMRDDSGKGKGFGRLVATDLRDHNFLMRDAIRTIVGPRKTPSMTSKAWDVTKEPGIPVDQGQTPRCGEFSMRNLLGVGPIKNRIADLPPEGKIYEMSQLQDSLDYGWARPFDGTTTRSVMKVGQKLGYWAEYRWSFGFDDACKEFLQTIGPCLWGTIWPDSFMSPVKRGSDYWLELDLENPTMFGPHAAGHLYCVFALYPKKIHPVTKKMGAVKMLQSWGHGWGDPTPDGTALMSFADAGIIHAEGGEIGMPLEQKLKVA